MSNISVDPSFLKCFRGSCLRDWMFIHNENQWFLCGRSFGALQEKCFFSSFQGLALLENGWIYAKMFGTNYWIMKRTIDYYIKNDFEWILTQCCQKATSDWEGLTLTSTRWVQHAQFWFFSPLCDVGYFALSARTQRIWMTRFCSASLSLQL